MREALPANSTQDSAGRLPASSTIRQTLPASLPNPIAPLSALPEAACPDAEAIDRLLNPARNLYRLETLNIGVHAPMMRALQHANYTFAKKISHTADSQDQRHRMVPGSPPSADSRRYARSWTTSRRSAHRGIPAPRKLYLRAMQDAWTAKNKLLDRGVPPEIALYLSSQRQIHPPGGDRLAAPSASQMDHAHLL